jgi:hypothetical protein
MPPLSSNLRSRLERTVIDARDLAEEGAWAALQRLAVDKPKPPAHFSPPQRNLRVKLRARGRQLGDRRKKNGEQHVYYLHRECAYEHWHQMLFARFLAENQLLMHPDGVAVSLEECEELAAEEGTDGWTLAARYASRMLPQIFRPDDPLLAVTFAPEDKQALEKLLSRLPQEVFQADDSLGWVYQFWQTKRKKEVNDSGEKIGADELPAVTQLFTEDYMVKFLLHNTLGAWWAGKKLTTEDTENAETEEELREKVALPGVEWEYLRFVREESASTKPNPNSSSVSSVPSVVKSTWRPAAGTFDGWPKQAAELKIMDPCCGSGHFLVAAFDLMVRIRMEEEGLSAAAACDAVLRDNLHGLEIDQRCTQIAAFALAFAAWTFPDAGGYREMPELHIACTGIAPQATEGQWIKLAEEASIPMLRGGEEAIRNGLINLHRLFADAPMLGSLIDPNMLPSDLLAADYETLQPYLSAALAAEQVDPETHERAVAAHGIVRATELLAREYSLVATNVPYLGRGKQDGTLQVHLEQNYKRAKADLATAFVLRILASCRRGGTGALVTPQNWLFLTTYANLREGLLSEAEWNAIARLGPGAFGTISGHVVNVALLVITARPAQDSHVTACVDVSNAAQPDEKAALLCGTQQTSIDLIPQAGQLKNPDARILVTAPSDLPLLEEYAICRLGLGTGDAPHYLRQLWELGEDLGSWRLFQNTTRKESGIGGFDGLVIWDAENQRVLGMTAAERKQAHNQDYRDREVWGRQGISVSIMSTLRTCPYEGTLFDKLVAAIVPNKVEHLPAISAFVESEEFTDEVRRIDQKLMVTNATLLKVPFDLSRWKKVAAARYCNGLPQPESDDPTQWLFHGRPEKSEAPLHVATARLLGYRWPAELDGGMRLSERARALVKQCDELLQFADSDGIVCLPAVSGETTGADRLQSLLSACGVKPTEDLDAWLRDKFFAEHCQLFHQRPFIWHIWDGRRKDGFHALVNYHKLDRKLLEKLIYGHLGDWISRQQGAERRGESGAEARRMAAEDLQQRLKVILEGEPPYDLFIRWKPLEEQPIGWDPDLNDGVRLNIRPFVTAGVLRKNPKIKWKKDRGKEPERPKDQYPWFWGWDEETKDFPGGPTFDGNRWNDCHYSNEAKRAAREGKLPSKAKK